MGGHGLSIVVGYIENKSDFDILFLPKTSYMKSKHYDYDQLRIVGGSDTLITRSGETNRFNIYFYDYSYDVYNKNIDSLMTNQKYTFHLGEVYINDEKIEIKRVKFIPSKFQN